MNHTGHTRLWVAAAIIASLIVVGFLFSVPHTNDIALPKEPKAASPVVPSVTLHDVFKKGVHTITGFVEASDACAAVSSRAFLDGNASEAQRIVVALSLEKSEGVCLELPTRVNFSATLAAPAQLPLTATVNGLVASTTVP